MYVKIENKDINDFIGGLKAGKSKIEEMVPESKEYYNRTKTLDAVFSKVVEDNGNAIRTLRGVEGILRSTNNIIRMAR